MKKCYLLLLLVFIMGCGASGRYVLTNESTKLSQFNNVYVGSFRGVDPSIAESSAYSIRSFSRNKEAEFALEKFKVELARIGFNVVSDINEADAYVDFNISSVRQVPVMGYIADEAIVKFINKENNEAIAYFTADTRVITPTVKSIVNNLGAQIRKHY